MSDLADWLAARLPFNPLSAVFTEEEGRRWEGPLLEGEDEDDVLRSITIAHLKSDDRQSNAARIAEAFLGLPLQERARLAGVPIDSTGEPQ